MKKTKLSDIKPTTAVASADREAFCNCDKLFEVDKVSALVGMSPGFVSKICGKKKLLTSTDILKLLDQDSFHETFVPRSKILDYLIRTQARDGNSRRTELKNTELILGNALDVLKELPLGAIQTVVTSTPYWAMRIYKDSFTVKWADGEACPYGHEQTPESFVRHTLEILNLIRPLLRDTGSVWWNVMDTFNTRTQIRSSAAEALRAMQGKDNKSWGEHDCRRYSAGHSYLKDGEQCMIPSQIAERASRIGYYVKSVITWAKTSSMPEPQETRVSRNLEYVIHLSKVRGPTFNKEAYRALPVEMGGRNQALETDKLSDVWCLPTSSGRDGHGAQFPVALPARCIAISSSTNDYILDPFVGSGNSGVAARLLGRRFIGIDVSDSYLKLARSRISKSLRLDRK